MVKKVIINKWNTMSVMWNDIQMIHNVSEMQWYPNDNQMRGNTNSKPKNMFAMLKWYIFILLPKHLDKYSVLRDTKKTVMKLFITRWLVVTLYIGKTFAFRSCANLQTYQSVSPDCPLLNRILQVFIILLSLQSTLNIHHHRSSSHQS
jgi:hypothetical protein